jgi:hypothetical protein
MIGTAFPQKMPEHAVRPILFGGMQGQLRVSHSGLVMTVA